MVSHESSKEKILAEWLELKETFANYKTQTQQRINDLELKNQELISQSPMLNATLDLINDGYWQYNLITDELTISESWRQRMKIDSSPLSQSGSSWSKLVYPDDLPGLTQHFRQHVSGQSEIIDYTYRSISEGKDIIWTLIKGHITQRDASGKPLLITGSLTDVTHVKKAENQLNERIKELKCTNNLSELFADEEAGTIDLFPQVVRLISPAMQFPEHTMVSIRYDGREWNTDGFVYTEPCIQSKMFDRGRLLGDIRVCLREDFNAPGYDRFLTEEQTLLNVIAHRITDRLYSEALRKELVDSELRFKQALEQTETVIWEVDACGLITYVNPLSELVWGYHPDELMGKMHFYDLHPAEGREEFKVATLEYFEKKVVFVDLVNQIVKKTGEVIYVLTNGSPRLDAKGNLLGYRGTDKDVTKRVLAEQRLKASEEKSNLILNSAAEAIYGVDTKGICTFVNQSCVDILGFLNKEQLVGKNIHELIHHSYPAGDPFPESHCSLSASFLKGEKIHLENDVFWRVDNSAIDVECWTHPLYQNNVLIGSVVTFIDVTEKKQIQLKIKQQQERLETIIHAIPDMLFVLGVEGDYLEYYATDKQMLIIPPEAIIGANLTDVFPPSEVQFHHQHINRCIEQNVSVVYEYAMEQEANLHYFEARLEPMEGRKVLALVRDVTEATQNKLLAESSERELFSVINSNNVYILTTDLKGDYTFCNQKFADNFVWMYGEEGCLGKSAMDSIHLDDQGKTRETVLKCIKTPGKSHEVEMRKPTKEGEYRYTLWQFTCRLNAQGHPDNILCVGIDITDRKLAEKEIIALNASLEEKVKSRTLALEQANSALSVEVQERKRQEVIIKQIRNNYELFFNTIDDLLFVLDAQGNMVHVNNVVVSRLGFTEEELKGQSVLLVHPPHRREEAAQIVGEMLQGRAEFCPVPLMTKSGAVIPVETRVKQGYWDGKPAIFGVSKDMTKIQLSEEKFSKAFHANSSLMAITNLVDGKYFDINDAFTRKLGYSRDMVLGRRSEDLGVFVRPEIRVAMIEKLLNGERVSDVEAEVRTVSGEMLTGLFSSDTIAIVDQHYMLTVMIDITERKKAERELIIARAEAERANLAKSEFLSRMSHELRTPMNSILGFAQLLELSPLDDKQRKRAAQIRKSGKYLLEMINEVLDISRIEAGKLSLSLEPVSLGNAIVEIVDAMTPMAHEYEVNIHLSNTINTLFVKADKQRIKQVLMNLVSNAIKYNKAGGEVKIHTHLIVGKDGKGVDTVRCAVTDTGIGISAENLNQLFRPFERIGAENTIVEGTGLGLAVVKKLTEAMGGSFGVESELGKGSTFWIELPLAPEYDMLIGNELFENQPALMNQVLTGTILYIEDNIANVELVEQTLLSYRPGIKLVYTANGLDAVGLAKTHMPQLILLDLNLPDAHGSDVQQQLTADEDTREIPIIVISADAMPRQIKRLKEAGVKEYLTKPLDIEHFLDVIDKYIV